MDRATSTVISLNSLKNISSELISTDFQYSKYINFKELLERTTPILQSLPDFKSNADYKRTVESIPRAEVIEFDNIWKDSILNWIMFTLFVPIILTFMLYIYEFLGINWLVFGIAMYALATTGIALMKFKNYQKRKSALAKIREIEAVINNLILYFKDPAYLVKLAEKEKALTELKNTYI